MSKVLSQNLRSVNKDFNKPYLKNDIMDGMWNFIYKVFKKYNVVLSRYIHGHVSNI